jgi:hypothetical protein
VKTTNLSAEAKVAAAVAVAFIALAAAAIGQGGGEAQSSGSNNYEVGRNVSINTEPREQGYKDSRREPTISR